MHRNAVSKAAGLALALFVCGSSADGVAASRDWTKHPAIIQLDTTEDVFAIGDAHGDPQRLSAVLTAAKLMDAAPSVPGEVKWTGGRAVLVITGDMIDKGKNSIGVIKLVRALQSDAANNGGRVIITMGNHEAEFLASGSAHGDKAKEYAKKTKEFGAELSTNKMNPVEVANCVGDIGEFLCGLPIAVRVNDWFFSHAGNTQNRSIAELSAAIEADFAKHGFAAKELVGPTSILEARLHGSPWFGPDPNARLAAYADKLGPSHLVKHLVQGHQYNRVKFPDGPNRPADYFFQRDGLLFLIDTGMSAGIPESQSAGGALRITGTAGNQMAIVICPNGKQKKAGSKEKPLWSDKDKKDNQPAQLCSR